MTVFDTAVANLGKEREIRLEGNEYALASDE